MRAFGSLQLLSLVIWAVFVGCDSFPLKEVSALTRFKEAIYEDPHMVLSDWNSLDSDPCAWSGVTCAMTRDHVVRILHCLCALATLWFGFTFFCSNVSGSSIRGFLVPDLGELTFLQELTLHGNKLLGILPKELGLLKYLTILDLGSNEFTGVIPPELGNLNNVVKINLQSNGLSGKLPPELGNLGNLEELYLDRNKLQGTVPAGGNKGHASNDYKLHGMSASNLTSLCRSSQLRVANFSYNFFVGNIPTCLEYLPRSSFQGNCLHKQNPKQRAANMCVGTSPKGHPAVNAKHKATKNVSKHSGTSRPAWLLALEIVTGIMACALVIVAVVTALQKCNSNSSIIIPWKKSGSIKDHTTVFIDSEMLKDVARFDRQELEVACEDFSNIIGSSPDSLVYKGNMKGGPEIAVISLCIKEENWTGYLELYFQREVIDLSRLAHDNTGKLLGYCSESSPFTRMLVFEYASNGTLYEHLHYGEGCPFSWTRRMKIVIGIARGLKYLHMELDPPFTISELNSSAVYLTDEFLPKLVDFESWKTIIARSEQNSGSIGSQGSFSVVTNSMQARHLDIQGNVYAFGVLLLEIISGRPPYCKDKGCLLDWAKDHLELPDAMCHVVDPELKNFNSDDLKVLRDVVNLCIHPDSSKRPSMQEVCAILESKIDTSVSLELTTSLAWAELALSS